MPACAGMTRLFDDPAMRSFPRKRESRMHGEVNSPLREPKLTHYLEIDAVATRVLK